jgi:hypothetical protein
MQLLENWDPLSLPRGSVRALITLTLLGVLSVLMLRGTEAPLPLAFVSLVALGHYFGSRSAAARRPGDRPPLFLPRGSIRAIIVLGLGAVAYFLWEDGKLRLAMDDRNSVILFVAAALVLGFLFRKAIDLVTRGRMTRPRRWIENLKAVVALAATALLAISCFSPRGEIDNAALLASPLIVFYFGSREGWTGSTEPAAAAAPVRPATSPGDLESEGAPRDASSVGP